MLLKTMVTVLKQNFISILIIFCAQVPVILILSPASLEDASQLSGYISSLLKGDNKEWDQMLKTGSGIEFSSEKFKDQLLQELLKEKLRLWILQKDAEGGDGPGILDEVAEGVLHLAAALGYDWALKPAILAGVNVDFRDVDGWTALQWAASCGREQAVDSLISLGAAPGALTDQSPNYPSGRTPADLASVNGHKGIAGYLADCSLDVHIPSINLDHQDDAAGPEAVQKISERSAAALSLAHFDEIAAINEEDEGPDDEWQDGEGLEKKKEERKKRAPDPALESGKACKILHGSVDRILQCSKHEDNLICGEFGGDVALVLGCYWSDVDATSD